MERILTRHPEGKQGVNIEKAKYDTMRRALLRVIPRNSTGIPFRDVYALVENHLDRDAFPEGVSVGWYVVTVKLDLEARGEIERVEGTRLQHLRRTTGSRTR
ncbi:hypothetical protein K8I85_14515 [bacterium]|nr:hypothetical protein [bacterium]